MISYIIYLLEIYYVVTFVYSFIMLFSHGKGHNTILARLLESTFLALFGFGVIPLIIFNTWKERN